MKVADGAWPGPTSPNRVGPDGTAFQPWGSCSASTTWRSVASPAALSVTRTAEAWPAVMVAGALTVTCRAPGVDAMPNAPCSGSPASAEEAPTHTRYAPAVCVQPLAESLHQDICCGVSVNDTRAEAPGARSTRWNPASWRAGSPAAAGSPRYSWATSLPARRPVLVTVADTRTSWVPSVTARLTRRPLNANRV